MAYNAIRINPLDLKPSIAIGVSIPFIGNKIFNSTYTTKDQIRSNILNFFLTNKRERLFNPEFGGDLRARVFEQISSQTLDNIHDIISTTLTNYFPQISIEALNINKNLDNNAINISFKYRVNETTIKDDLSIELQQ